MASHIEKFNYGVFSIIVLVIGISVAVGQSTVGCHQNEEQQTANGVARAVSEFESYFREAIALTKSEFEGYFREAIALTKGVRSDIQILKGEIEMLKNRIKDYNKSANSSNQELKRQLLAHDLDIISQSEIQRQQPRCRSCPEVFNYYVAGYPKCYAVLDEKVNWTTAQERCRQLHENAQLAVIVNSREQQIITEKIKNLNCTSANNFPNDSFRHGINAFWIGARRRRFNCNLPLEWISNNGTATSIQYTNWAPDEPNCASQVEACVSLNKHTAYKWNDLSCSWSACPLCEVTVHA